MHLDLHHTGRVHDGDPDAKAVSAALIQRTMGNRQRYVQRQGLLSVQFLGKKTAGEHSTAAAASKVILEKRIS